MTDTSLKLKIRAVVDQIYENEMDSFIQSHINQIDSDPDFEATVEFYENGGASRTGQRILTAVYDALLKYYPVDTLMSKEQRELFHRIN